MRTCFPFVMYVLTHYPEMFSPNLFRHLQHGLCLCFTRDGRLARITRHSPFSWGQDSYTTKGRLYLVTPSYHLTVSTLSFCPHGLLHCMRIGTNFSTRIRLAEMVFSTTQVSHTSRHATPKHASWFNMAEIEIGVMDRQCIGGRLASEAMLKSEVAAWKRRRNQAQTRIEWEFTRQDADHKLSRHYVS